MNQTMTLLQPGALASPKRLVLGLLVLVLLGGPVTSTFAEAEPGRIPISREGRPEKSRSEILGSESSSSTGWWFGSAGIALVLAVCGGISMAAKKYLPPSSSAQLQVVGRVSLSPKHSVYLLRAEGRVLLIGAGPQGSPSLLAELSDSTPGTGGGRDFLPVTESLSPLRARDRESRSGAGARSNRLDVRLGDEG